MWNYGQFSITSAKQNRDSVCQLRWHRDLKSVVFNRKMVKTGKYVWFSPVFDMFLISTFYGQDCVQHLETDKNWYASLNDAKVHFWPKNVHFWQKMFILDMFLNFESFFMNGIVFRRPKLVDYNRNLLSTKKKLKKIKIRPHDSASW